MYGYDEPGVVVYPRGRLRCGRYERWDGNHCFDVRHTRQRAGDRRGPGATARGCRRRYPKMQRPAVPRGFSRTDSQCARQGWNAMTALNRGLGGGERLQRHLCIASSHRRERSGTPGGGRGCASSQQPEERQPVRMGRHGTIMITKSMSIVLLLMAALLLGTIASIHAQSQPRLQPMFIHNSRDPSNPNQPQDEPAARRRA